MEECRPDLVVLCTGYKQDWSWIGDGYPKGPDECDVRGVCSTKDESIAFIGFQRPGVGKCIYSHIPNYYLQAIETNCSLLQR